MNFKFLIRSIKKTGEDEKETSKDMTIGSIAKRKRISMNLTQSDVAESICSVSYLSKIETNKIHANQNCLDLLMERINVPEWEMHVLENGPEMIKESATFFYHNEKDSYRTIYDDLVEVKENQTADVVKLGYDLMSENLDEAKTLISTNIPLTSSMDKDLLKMFSYYTAEFCYMTANYADTSDILSSLDEMALDDITKTLVDDLAFRLYAATGRPMNAALRYRHLLEKYAETLHIERLVNLKLSFAKLLYNEQEYEEAIKVCMSIANVGEMAEDGRFNSIVGSSFYNLKREITAKDYLDKIDENSPYFIGVVPFKYAISPDKKAYLCFLKELNLKSHDVYLDYFIRKEEGTLDREFFVSDAFLKAINRADVYEAIEYLKEKRNFLQGIARYKDASIVNESIEELRSIKKEQN